MSDLKTRVAGIVARANHPGTPAEEADTCRLVLARLRAKYGEDVDRAIELALGAVTIEAEHKFKTDEEGELATWAAEYLGLSAFKKRNGNSGAWRRIVYVEGPPVLVDAWRELLRAHAERLEEVLTGALIGFLQGAMPREIPKAEHGEKRERLSDEKREALVAGLEIGKRAAGALRSALPMGK